MMIPAGTLLAGSYDPLIVALSVVIAVAASYAALDRVKGIVKYASARSAFDRTFQPHQARTPLVAETVRLKAIGQEQLSEKIHNSVQRGT